MLKPSHLKGNEHTNTNNSPISSLAFSISLPPSLLLPRLSLSFNKTRYCLNTIQYKTKKAPNKWEAWSFFSCIWALPVFCPRNYLLKGQTKSKALVCRPSWFYSQQHSRLSRWTLLFLGFLWCWFPSDLAYCSFEVSFSVFSLFFVHYLMEIIPQNASLGLFSAYCTVHLYPMMNLIGSHPHCVFPKGIFLLLTDS